jgi:hypothetical protein
LLARFLLPILFLLTHILPIYNPFSSYLFIFFSFSLTLSFLFIFFLQKSSAKKNVPPPFPRRTGYFPKYRPLPKMQKIQQMKKFYVNMEANI